MTNDATDMSTATKILIATVGISTLLALVIVFNLAAGA